MSVAVYVDGNHNFLRFILKLSEEGNCFSCLLSHQSPFDQEFLSQGHDLVSVPSVSCVIG